MSEVGGELSKLVTIVFQSSDQLRVGFLHGCCSYFSKDTSIVCYFASSVWSSEEGDANGFLVDGLVSMFDSREEEGLDHHYQLSSSDALPTATANLLYDYSSERVSYEYDGPPRFLVALSVYSKTQRLTAYIFLYSFVNKIAKQLFCMIPHVRGCVSERPICVISEGQDTRIFDIERKKLLKPGCVRFWASPSFR